MPGDETRSTRRGAIKAIGGSAAAAIGGVGAVGAATASDDTEQSDNPDPAITIPVLRDAIDDWLAREIPIAVVSDIITCWQRDFSLEECKEAEDNGVIGRFSLFWITNYYDDE